MAKVETVALIAAIALTVVILALVAVVVVRKRRAAAGDGKVYTRRRLRHARMTSEDLAKDLVENVNLDQPATTAVLDVLISEPDLLPENFRERVDEAVGTADALPIRIDEKVIEKLKMKLDDMPAYLERISSGRFVTAAPDEDADVAVWEAYLSSGMVYKEEALREAVTGLVDDLPVVASGSVEIDTEQEAEQQQRLIAEGVLVDPSVPGVLPEDIGAAARGLAQVQKRKRGNKPKGGLASLNVPLPSFKKTGDESEKKTAKSSAQKAWGVEGAAGEPVGIDWRELGLPEDIPHAFIAQR